MLSIIGESIFSFIFGGFFGFYMYSSNVVVDDDAIIEEDQLNEENLSEVIDNSRESSYGEDMKKQPESGDKIATITTNQGTIKVLLYQDLVPETTKNFIELANSGKYDGSVFHRVIEDFMIQGGDFETGTGIGGYSYKGPGTTIDDEFADELKHIYGAVSMANAGPNTGGSQFFIVQNQDGTSWLDGAHSVFGYVYEGMDVVEKIAALETDATDRPAEEVVMEKVEISDF